MSATKTIPDNIAKLLPRFPASVDLPNRSVIKAPANTPTIFIMPYAVARYLEDTNWQSIGMLLASNMPKPKPKQNAAPITENRESPKPSNNKAGIVNPNPMALV